ncbi:proteoglycan 4-like [Patiria miniata]|uniref:Ig-like domain-containing protein n=1 Tax=Patiria miniata TaxID=46514 RepID=A0A913ZZ73_PATMI|nr:proteoglycan 4-like [Patiria miniata]
MPVRGFLKMLLALFVFCTLNLRHGISGLPLPEQHTFRARASVRSRIEILAASRSKRSSDDSIIKEPFYGTPSIQVYLQMGQTFHMPCPIRREGEKVSVFLWFKGGDLVARHTIVAGDTNFTQSDRFQLSGTYGLIVRQVEQDDGGTYTCRVIPYGSSKSRRSSTDVTVLDKQFPAVDDALATRQEQNFTRGQRHELPCPAALPENGNRRATVYWCLDTGESDFTSIIGVKFSDGETNVYLEEYNITVDSSLVINSLKSNYSRFWCHRSVSGSQLKSGIIDVNGKDPRPGEMPMVTTHEPGHVGNVKLSVILGLIFGLLSVIACLVAIVLFVWKHSGTFPEPEDQIQQNRQETSVELIAIEEHQDETSMATADEGFHELTPLTEATGTDTSVDSDLKDDKSSWLTADTAANTRHTTGFCGESSSSRTNADQTNAYIRSSPKSCTTFERIVVMVVPHKVSASSQKPVKVTSKKPSLTARRSAPKSKQYLTPKKSSHREAGETQPVLQKATTPECAKSEQEKVPLVEIVQPKDEIPSKTSGEQQQDKLLGDEGNNKDHQDWMEGQQALQDSETGCSSQTSVVEEETPQTASAPEQAPTEIAETGTKTIEKKVQMKISDEKEGVKTAKPDVSRTTDRPKLSSNPTQDQTKAGKVENDKSEGDNNLSPGHQKGKKGKLEANKKKAKWKERPKVEPKWKTKYPVKVPLTSDDEKTSKTGSQLESQLQPGDKKAQKKERDEHRLTPEKDPEQTSNQQVAVCGSEGIASVVESSPSNPNRPVPSVPEPIDDNLNAVSGEKLSKTIPVAKKRRDRKSPCLTSVQNAKPQKSSEPPSCEQMNPTAPANKAIERGGDATMSPAVYPTISDPDVAPTQPNKNYHLNPTQPIAAVKPFTCNDTASPHFSIGAAAASVATPTPVPETTPYKDDTHMSHVGTPEDTPIPSFTQTTPDNSSDMPVSTNWEDPQSAAGSPEVPVPLPNPLSSDDEPMDSKSGSEHEEIEMEDSVEHQAVKESGKIYRNINGMTLQKSI